MFIIKWFLPFSVDLWFWNILYAVLFGWWVAAVYCLVGGIMYITVVGKDHGKIPRGTTLSIIPFISYSEWKGVNS